MRTERVETGLIARLLVALSAFSCAHPWWMLWGGVVTCAVSLLYASTSLTFKNQRNDLHHQDKDYYKRWRQYVAEFGDDDDMVVVVQGSERLRMEEAIDYLAGRIQAQPERFDRLFHKVDLRCVHDRALLFLGAGQIKQIQENLKNMSLLLEPPVLGNLDPLFGWKSLNLTQLLHEGERRVASLAATGADPGKETFLPQLDAICRAAAEFLRDPGTYRNPWTSTLPAQPQERDLLSKPQYFFSEDGRLAFLLVRPYKDERDGFTFAQKSIDALRQVVREAGTRFDGIEFGVTGIPVLENDEMIASQDDSGRASWLALVGVALLYFVVYRCLRYPCMTVATLLVGAVWALGWTTLTVGHLNILSSAFAVMLIGMGDYGILWVTRFSEERRRGAALNEAMALTAASVGPSILTAAMTTALAFYAAMLADLQAVAELGWIAGSGVLLCAVSCFTLMPALLAIFEGRRPEADEAPVILSYQERRADHRPWLAGLSGRPALVIACSLGLTLGLGSLATSIRYDSNLLKLQAQGLDSVRWERTLMEHTLGASWHALSWTTTPEEALALKERFEKLPEVSRVIEVASLVPLDQSRKLEQLHDIQARLRRLPPRGTLVERQPPILSELQRAARHLQEAIAFLPGKHEAITSLSEGLRTFSQRMESIPADPLREQMRQFEQLLCRDLAEDLHQLRDVSTPAPIRVDDLPQSLRERYLGSNGKWLVRVFAKDPLWDYQPLEAFTRQIASVDPDATGKPFTTFEGLRAMKYGFLWAGVYALVAMVLVLLLDFGNVKHTLLALLPVGMGLVGALGLMVLGGGALNPANMIAFPLILGVGADNGVHVLHDYRNRRRGASYHLSASTGRGILIAALTTILGFGTLMFSQHRGLASLGVVLTLGVTCCTMTSLVFLPALLRVRRGIQRARILQRRAA